MKIKINILKEDYEMLMKKFDKEQFVFVKLVVEDKTVADFLVEKIVHEKTVPDEYYIEAEQIDRGRLIGE